jgi:hypothetical protein
MPTLNEVMDEVSRRRGAAQDEVRRDYIAKLAKYTGRDTIVFASAFSSNKGPEIPGIAMSVGLADVQGFMSALHGLKGESLDLVLHSPGGSIEAAEQVVQYLRAKYKHIRAIVPQNAMSAATMIACACDEIIMGKHSAIGPIDPQVTFPTPAGAFTAPAQAILEEFELAKQQLKDDPQSAPIWLTKLQAYPPGFLNICSTTLTLAKSKVGSWLDANMFKDVANGEKPGSSIAAWLGDATEHKTHGRPIGIETAREKGLKVTELEADQQLQEAVLSTFHAVMVTFQITQCVKLIENQNGKGVYTQIQVKAVPVSS